MSRIPDSFIVGAPKCGTTALHAYLGAHPEVFVATRKEIHFFGSDLPFTHERIDRDGYLRLFAGWGGEKRGLEGSVWYLYSQAAAREIRAFNPEARIIIMLRHPVDVMYSLHSQGVYNGTEDLADFGEALAAEPERRAGRRLPRNFRNAMGFRYRDTVRFAAQVRRYLETFGRDRVHVILYDDFRRDVPGSYRDVCRFLEIDPDFRPRFAVVNPNKDVWSSGLRDLLRFAPSVVRASLRAGVPSAAVRQGVKRRLLSLNTRHVPRLPMDAALRRRLDEELRPEIEALGQLLGRDLVALWCRTDAAAVAS